MNKTIAAAAMAASLTAGGMAGMVLGAPGLAGAQTAAHDAVSWVDETLSGLVSDGTITQAQSDAVETALDEARPERGMGRHHRGSRHLDVVAEALGMTEDHLRTALGDSQTIAEIASSQGVDVQAVVDALVADKQTRLDEAVTAGELTQEEADARLARARERYTAVVNGQLPTRGDRGGRGGAPQDGAHAPTEDGATEEGAAS